MRETVLHEMEHIPSSPKPQKDLRMVYWPFRMQSLGKNAEGNKIALDVLSDSIAHIKKHGGVHLPKGTNYEFLYDRNFFRNE